MMKDSQNEYVGTWGTYHWGKYKDQTQHIHPQDLPKLKGFRFGVPIGLVFHCVGKDEDYLILRFGDIYLRVKPEVYLPKTETIKFEVGDWVYVKADPTKKGVIYEIQWHYNDEKPVFFIRINGTRKSTRRYYEDELEKLEI